MPDTEFWQTSFGRFSRWILFLPIGFILVSIAQALPPVAATWAASYKPEFNFLTLIIGIIAVSLLGTAGWFWCIAVFMIPSLTCKCIAPNNKVGSIIFGTVYCLLQAISILSLLSSARSWIFITYMVIVAGIVIGGTVAAYKD